MKRLYNHNKTFLWKQLMQKTTNKRELTRFWKLGKMASVQRLYNCLKTQTFQTRFCHVAPKYFYWSTYVYIIDQARGQDGWILAEFSFCVFMDRDEVEVHKNAKRERGQYLAILNELAWSIKNLLYGIKSTEKNDLRTSLFSSTEKETI